MTVAPSTIAARPLKGVLLVLLATVAFAAVDTLTKYLAMRHSVPVVVAVRYLVNLALLTVLPGPSLGPRLWRAQRRGLVFLRGLCLALASLSMGWRCARCPSAKPSRSSISRLSP